MGSSLVVVDPELEPYPQQLTTALFSFLYHLASYENGWLIKCYRFISRLQSNN